MDNMNRSIRNSGCQTYLRSIIELQMKIMEEQQETFDRVAAEMVATIQRRQRIFVFGTGHSHMMAEEAFYRAGGLAAAVPILMTDLMLHENPDLSSRLERTPGLAGILLDQYQAAAGEMLFVYSNSGVNQLPVEIAASARQRGLVTVAVCSRAYARIAPLSAVGKRLDEVAEFVIDNYGVAGDALVPVEGSEWRVASSSTIAGALIWNALVAEVIFRLRELKEELPFYVSLNMPGAFEHNKALLQKWGAVNPHLIGWISHG